MANHTSSRSRLGLCGDQHLITAVTFIALGLSGFLCPVAHAVSPFDLEVCLQALTPDITPAISSQTDAMFARDFAETERLAESIAKFARLNTSEFVMLGRSPTMLAAFYEAQRKMFSGLQNWVLPLSFKNERKLSSSILAARFTKLEDVFRKAAGPRRPMVYIDAVAEGRTLIALDRILVALDRKALLLGFSDDVVSAKAQLEKAHIANFYEIIPVSHDYMMHLAAHKTWAPYASYVIEDDPKLDKAPIANARFFDLRLKIEKRLELD